MAYYELTKSDLTINPKSKVLTMLKQAKTITKRIENTVHPLDANSEKKCIFVAKELLDTCLLKLAKATDKGETTAEGWNLDILKDRVWAAIDHKFKERNNQQLFLNQ